MTVRSTRVILFLQGGGDGTHDAWDDALVESLRRELGEAIEVRYPRMPDEDDPSDANWGPTIDEAVGGLPDGAVVVGHSVGGTILVHRLVVAPPSVALGAIVLVSAPFAGPGGWPGGDADLPDDAADRLPADVPVHVFHGLADETVPPAHADLYARAIPRAHVHRLPDRDHQLGNDLAEVARVIRALRPAPGDTASG